MPRAVKIDDIKKYLKTAEERSTKKFQEIFNNKKGKNWEKDSEYWKGRWDSYVDIKYMILEKDDDRQRLRLDSLTK
jgi:hypothetical protein